MTFTRAWSSALIVVALACGACSSGKDSSAPSSPKPTSIGPSTSLSSEGLTITSSAFAANGPIPSEYTCSGAGKTVPISYQSDVVGATSLALIVHDPEAPVSDGFTHWVVTGLPNGSGHIPPVPPGARQLVAWRPPCPPKGSAPHHYRFTLYAVRGPVTSQSAIPKAAIAHVELVGTYSR